MARSEASIPASQALAVFDLDGTLTVGDGHARLLLGLLRDHRVPGRVRAEIVGGCLAYLTGLLPNRWTKEVVARAWQGRARVEIEAETERFVQERVLPDLSTRVLARLREHQSSGHRVVLLSASLSVMVAPVARALEIGELRAVDLGNDGDRVAPTLGSPCFHGQEKARWLAALADRDGLDLGGAWAYGNSHGDRHFMALVGQPVAVGPDPLLLRHARRHGWEILAHGQRRGEPSP